MDSKIPAHFWLNDALASPELLLAAAWLRSHAGINLAGYAEISARRFSFETHLSPEALDRVSEALGKGLVRQGNEYWLRDFIADEFGRGPTLACNNMSAAVVKDLATVRSPWVALAVLEEYPELKPRFEAYRAVALGKPLPRSTQVQGARAGAGVRAGGKDRGPGERIRGGVSRAKNVGEVIACAADQNLGISEGEAAKFFDHFEANGWRQGGKTPLRSWQAALRNWVRRAGAFGKNSVAAVSSPGGDFDPSKPNAHTDGAQEAV